MDTAITNPWGITHTDWATDMSGATLEQALIEAGKPYQKEHLPMGGRYAEPASIITYGKRDGTPVANLIINFSGPDSWKQEIYIMVGVSHADAIAIDWPGIIEEVRRKVKP